MHRGGGSATTEAPRVKPPPGAAPAGWTRERGAALVNGGGGAPGALDGGARASVADTVLQEQYLAQLCGAIVAGCVVVRRPAARARAPATRVAARA